MKILHTITMIWLLSLVSGCSVSPEPSASEEARAEATIHYNRTEAKRAQEEYIRLQKSRNQ